MKLSKLVFRLMQCREAQQAASREIDGDLGLWKRLLFRLHRRYCWCCDRYWKQLAVIRRLVRGMEEKHTFEDDEKLSSDARQRIRETISRAAENDTKGGD